MAQLTRLAARIHTAIHLRDRAIGSLAAPGEVTERNRKIAALIRLYDAAGGPFDPVFQIEQWRALPAPHGWATAND